MEHRSPPLRKVSRFRNSNIRNPSLTFIPFTHPQRSQMRAPKPALNSPPSKLHLRPRRQRTRRRFQLQYPNPRIERLLSATAPRHERQLSLLSPHRGRRPRRTEQASRRARLPVPSHFGPFCAPGDGVGGRVVRFEFECDDCDELGGETELAMSMKK